jgi:uncharacterized GH25 family protein
MSWLFLSQCLVASSCLAHEFWIEPPAFTAPVGATLDVHIYSGTDFAGDNVPRIDDWFTRFDLTDQTGTRQIPGLMGDVPAGVSPPLREGGAVISYVSTATLQEFGARKFETYLRQEGLNHILIRRDQLNENDDPAREHYYRYAKALVRTGGDPSVRFSQPIGLHLELVPEASLYDADPIERFRLLQAGIPMPNTQVSAFHRKASRAPLRRRTDADGRVQMKLNRDGLWLINAVTMHRAGSDRGLARWVSHWASLTFAR